MRTLVSAFAGLALLAGVSSVPAIAADVQSSQAQRTVAFTAGQGGSMSFVLPSTGDQWATGPAQALAVTAGQTGSITVIVPGPGAEIVAKAPAAKPANGAQLTLLPSD